jgi:hypothetical protein
MKVNIEVKEILSRVISIDAETVDEAIAKVEDMYFREEVVLDYADFDGNVEIEESKTDFML